MNGIKNVRFEMELLCFKDPLDPFFSENRIFLPNASQGYLSLLR